MKRRLPILLFLVVAAGAAFFLWRRSAAEGRAALVLSGTLEARTADVGSLVGGRVMRVAVDEGSIVKAGDLLVELEDHLLVPQIGAQQRRVEAARAALDRAVAGPRREEVDRARIALDAATTERRRVEALFRDGVMGQRDLDQANVVEATARKTWEEADRGTRKEDLAEARAVLAAEQATLDALEAQHRELAIVAPAAGRIETMDLRPGDLVGPGRPVLRILEPDELWVRVYVPEPKLALVRVGDAATLRVDTFANRSFPGRVVEIRQEAEYLPRNVQTIDQRVDQFFAVKVRLDPTPPELHPGMAAFVTLGETAAPGAAKAEAGTR